MRTKIFTVIAAIAVICAVSVNSVNAQCRYYDRGSGLFGDGVSFYAGFGAGAALVNNMSSPAFSVRIGADAGLFIGEIEGSYLSVNSLYDKDGYKAETNTLSTMTVGMNIGVKFLSSDYGHLALMLHTGYALQEEWYHGDYGYDYHNGHAYHGKHYLGVGLNGSIDLSPRIALFGEARYQSIPIDGRGETKWGGVFQGGLKFYF